MSVKEVWQLENGILVDTWKWGPEHHNERTEFGDKSEWGQGPWVDEPDKLSWTDPASGLPCLIVRGPAGSLCGYVAVDETHPQFGRDYCSWNGDEPYPDVDVHGGLTFAGPCDEDAEDESVGICHVPEPGRSDNVWWFGFDCAHAFDFAPGMQWTLQQCFIRKGDPIPSYAQQHDYDVYRDVNYVMAECTSLAAQLAALRMPELPAGPPVNTKEALAAIKESRQEMREQALKSLLDYKKENQT